MRLGGQTVLIAPPHPHEPNATAPSFPHYGLEHIGLTVDDADAAVEELRAKGAEITIGPLTHNPGLRLAFIRGPENIMIELVQRGRSTRRTSEGHRWRQATRSALAL